MPAFGSEFIVVGRTLAAIVVHAPDPAVSIGFLEGAGTTLTHRYAPAVVGLTLVA
jgi:hypothetical protein